MSGGKFVVFFAPSQKEGVPASSYFNSLGGVYAINRALDFRNAEDRALVGTLNGVLKGITSRINKCGYELKDQFTLVSMRKFAETNAGKTALVFEYDTESGKYSPMYGPATIRTVSHGEMDDPASWTPVNWNDFQF